MNKKIRQFVNKLIIPFLAVGYMATSVFAPIAWADDGSSGFTVSPMNQSIVLSPGDTYKGSFKIANPNNSVENLAYTIEQRSFYVDDEYNTTYDEVDSPIVEWTTIDSEESGILEPNESVDVMFTINVPESANAGGQYEAFRVISNPVAVGGEGGGMTIQEKLVITHLVFVEIMGDTTREGEIVSAEVPGFLFDGNIRGTSMIKNTGNIYGRAKYTLQVFPLFSDEEIYTNEENPETRLILPDRTLYNAISWRETPSFGIFNVVYTAEFEGVTAQVKKMVIVCPIWLLFVIIATVFLIIGWLVIRARSRKKGHRRVE